jgi:hypothetical protein
MTLDLGLGEGELGDERGQPDGLVHQADVVGGVREAEEVAELVGEHERAGDLREDDPAVGAVGAFAPVDAADLLALDVDVGEAADDEHVDDAAREPVVAEGVALVAGVDLQLARGDGVGGDDLEAGVDQGEVAVDLDDLLAHPCGGLDRAVGGDDDVQVDPEAVRARRIAARGVAMYERGEVRGRAAAGLAFGAA